MRRNWSAQRRRASAAPGSYVQPHYSKCIGLKLQSFFGLHPAQRLVCSSQSFRFHLVARQYGDVTRWKSPIAQLKPVVAKLASALPFRGIVFGHVILAVTDEEPLQDRPAPARTRRAVRAMGAVLLVGIRRFKSVADLARAKSVLGQSLRGRSSALELGGSSRKWRRVTFPSRRCCLASRARSFVSEIPYGKR